MAVRLRPSSLSQRLRLLPMSTQGNPLMTPSSMMRAMRRSQYTASDSIIFCMGLLRG